MKEHTWRPAGPSKLLQIIIRRGDYAELGIKVILPRCTVICFVTHFNISDTHEI